MRRKKELIVICIFCCLFTMGCIQASEKRDISKNETVEKTDTLESQVPQETEIKEDIEKKIDNIAKKASECNYNTENYLFYEGEKEISLYFSINISKLDIKRLDLYNESELVYKNTTVKECYDNVIKVLVKEYIPYFDYVKLYDSAGKEMKIYVGKHYLEKYNCDDEIEDILDISNEVEDNKWGERMKFFVPKEEFKKYNIEVLLPLKIQKMFCCTRTEDERENNVVITMDLKLKEKYKKVNQITFEANIIQIEKKTERKVCLNRMYIPMVRLDE